MTKALLAAAAFIAMTASVSAFARELPVRAPVLRAPPIVVSDPWTGFYVGANLGYSWGDWDASSNQSVFNYQSTTASPKVNGIVGGLQAGYNWKINPQWLWGVEADIQITGEKASQAWTDPGIPFIPPAPPPDVFVPRCCGPASLSHEWKFPWFGTARLRAGYLPSENWLLYATGGLAFGESKYSFNFSQPGSAVVPAPTSYALSNSDTKVGFAVGAGTEVKIDRNWSVKLEYLYVDLGKTTINTTDIDGQPFRVDYQTRDHIARVGVNYRLGQ